MCGASHQNVGGATVGDYSPHHSPFEYYTSTANPHHLPPKNLAEIGHNGRANHNYDLTDFDQAVMAGKLPAVSFLKASEYQDGHAGYSDPIDEQHFLVTPSTRSSSRRSGRSTAIVVAYDDSDGWYDHAFAAIGNSSHTADDAEVCTSSGAPTSGGYTDRCGPGPRQPLLVISPWAKTNFVDHRRTDQTSTLKFVEDNWSTGKIGDASFDANAGGLTNMFDFTRPRAAQVLLREDGSVRSVRHICHPHGGLR